MGSWNEQGRAVHPRRSTSPRVLNTLLILELFEKPVRLVRADRQAIASGEAQRNTKHEQIQDSILQMTFGVF